jgi:hypothetical protein
MYPIPTPMFALSPKFDHNSWHSQYKSIVAKFSPSLPFAPIFFPPQPWHSQKCFKSEFINVFFGHVMRDSWYGKWCASLVLVTWEVMGVKNDKMKNVVPMRGPRADWGQRGKDLQQYKSTDWPTRPPTLTTMSKHNARGFQVPQQQITFVSFSSQILLQVQMMTPLQISSFKIMYCKFLNHL